MANGHGLHMGHFFNKERNAFGADRQLYQGERHGILFGPNGSGKFTRLLAVNLLSDCLDDKSVVVIDPKGEAAAVTAWHRHELGHDVKVLDPFGELRTAVEHSPAHQKLIAAGLTQSVGFEPLDVLETGTVAKPCATFYDDAAKLGDALIKIDMGDTQKHWPESAQGLTVGLLMWEKLRNQKAANLENVRALLTAGNLGNRVTEIIDKASSNEYQARGGAAIVSLLNRFLVENNEVAGIRSAADTQTRWMLSQPMAASFKAKDRIDFRELKTGKRPVTVYVVIPAAHLRTHSVWLRLVLTTALQALYRPGGRKVVMLIDEMAALGHLGPLEDAFGLVRGYGVQLVGILQDLPQLKELYKDRWQSFLANAGVLQFFTPNDLDTAEWMSKRAGKTTIWKKGVGESEAGEGQKRESENWNQTGVDLFPAYELFDLPNGVGLAWLAGMAATVKFMAPNYWELKRCTARALPSPYYAG
jgi:type IV secretion system protein VirD4